MCVCVNLHWILRVSARMKAHDIYLLDTHFPPITTKT